MEEISLCNNKIVEENSADLIYVLESGVFGNLEKTLFEN